MATSAALTNFSFTVHMCETRSQPSSSFKRRLTPILPNSTTCKRISLVYVLCLPSQTTSEWHSQVFKISTFPRHLSLLPLSSLPRRQQTLGCSIIVFHHSPRVWATKGTLLLEFSRGPESNILILIHAAVPHVPQFLRICL